MSSTNTSSTASASIASATTITAATTTTTATATSTRIDHSDRPEHLAFIRVMYATKAATGNVDWFNCDCVNFPNPSPKSL
jgi:hypothetical protein